MEWCKKWKLNINPTKCNIVSFTTNTRKVTFDYTLYESLTRTTETKDLGVTLNYKLNYNKHIADIVNAAFKLLGMLKRDCLYIKKESTVLLLYKILVRSKLEYASVI